MEYEDFIIQIEPGHEDQYVARVVKSLAGEGRGTFRLPCHPDRLRGLWQMAHGQERSASISGQETRRLTPPALPSNANAWSLEALGERLFQTLFIPEVRSLYDQSLGSLREYENRGLRIKLKLDPTHCGMAQINSLPWEFLRRKETREFLSLSRNSSIVRYLEVSRPTSNLPLPRPLRILVVAPNPSGVAPLNLERERYNLKKTLGQKEGVEIIFLLKPTLADLREKLLQSEFHVLHYMGHGDVDHGAREGVLCFEDAYGGKDTVSGQVLATHLSDFSSLRLVFLNACETAVDGYNPMAGVASALVLGGLSAVVAMQFPISDRAAITFSKMFYKRLASGDPVDAAVAEGRQAVFSQDHSAKEWGTPVLFLRLSDGKLFTSTEEKKNRSDPNEVDLDSTLGKSSGTLVFTKYTPPELIAPEYEPPQNTALEYITPNYIAAVEDPDSNLQNAYIQWLRSWFQGRNLFERLNAKIIGWMIFAPFALLGLLLKMVIVPALASQALETFAEGHGIEITVANWSANLSNLKATAHQVTIFATGPYDQKEFLKTDAVEVDLSLWSRLRGKTWIREVRIREPELYLERLLTGRWNWHDLAMSQDGEQTLSATSSSTDSGAADEADFSLPQLVIEEMDLQWVENLPADSKGGLIQDLKATLFVDDISFKATDLRGLVDPRPQPSRLSLEARSGNGKISFDGKANLFHRSAMPTRMSAGGASTELAWTPSLNARIYLENVGANAFSRLTPDAPILPERGFLSGDIELRLSERELDCMANLRFQDVTFAINRSSPLVGTRAKSLESQLDGYRVTGSHQFHCGGLLGSEDYRPFHSFLSSITSEGVSEAPKTVQAVAAIEHSRYSEDPIDPSLQGEADQFLLGVNPKVVDWMRRYGLVKRGPAGRGFPRLR